MKTHNWYVIQVMSGQEKKVKRNIEENRKSAGMDDYVEEVIIPSENVSEVKRGEQKISEKRLWPGYALIKMILTDESWQYVKQSNGVIDFMGAGNPVPISENEIDELLSDIQVRKEKIVHKNKLKPDDKVKIVDGVFVNFIGTVIEVSHEKGRLSAMVSIFGRDTRVDDLEFWQVEEVTDEA